ncbi:CGNR zinc finger domain-containing protein [Robbsia sp. Bb-Pol-6]|uniref:CGNR zinc finger domain-containing protein n=1 Tax=Robbsia betulipollinis TaxID=2981849 RepID=A0ABT3ZRX0_9BURK|nr:CGNR zinc finger domain-containing protein [Robbsia betulipollinis]MCY0389299.1 CGNR zinc finger domain-containing protein [Robbsia betulipollinis]
MRLRVAHADPIFVAFVPSMVANAILTSEWRRLKTCAGCRRVFYDHTRNGSKRWCGMTKGGPDGRAR